ncbi:MAG TPA: hypothetical protein ENJ95_00725, partial [Bacteroidetes bacterium]|nr:hypothetical protein [Bacteroidota bacterium]
MPAYNDYVKHFFDSEFIDTARKETTWKETAFGLRGVRSDARARPGPEGATIQPVRCGSSGRA